METLLSPSFAVLSVAVGAVCLSLTEAIKARVTLSGWHVLALDFGLCLLVAVFAVRPALSFADLANAALVTLSAFGTSIGADAWAKKIATRAALPLEETRPE